MPDPKLFAVVWNVDDSITIRELPQVMAELVEQAHEGGNLWLVVTDDILKSGFMRPDKSCCMEVF